MADESFPLALVTGAAHRLGKAIALEFARHGYAIGLHYHLSSDDALQTEKELKTMGVPVEMLQADLTDPVQIEAIFERVGALPNHLKVLVNSAAVMASADLSTMAVDEWDATMALNLRAPWLCARAAVRLMIQGGVIVNLIDSGVRKTWSTYPAYSVSKAALEALTRLLAKSLAPAIRVNAIAPGLILPSNQMPAAEWQRLVNRLPVRHAGRPEDVAKAVWFLVESDYVTGETIVVDGGYQLV